jgi:hypothetical protein
MHLNATITIAAEVEFRNVAIGRPGCGEPKSLSGLL